MGRRCHPFGFGSGVREQLSRMRLGLGNHAVGLRLCLRQEAIGLCTRMRQQRIGLRGGLTDEGVGAHSRVADQLVALIEDVLRVVEVAGDGVLDVVEQFEHVASGDHATRSHRHTARFFDDGAQFIQRFEYPVHSYLTPRRDIGR